MYNISLSMNIERSSLVCLSSIIIMNVSFHPVQSDNTSTPKRCSYTMEFKLQAVQYAKQTNKSAAARTFNVARKRIHDWCKQEAVLEQQIRSAAGNRKKVEGGGCRPMYTALERSLAAWVREERDQGTTITGQVCEGLK